MIIMAVQDKFMLSFSWAVSLLISSQTISDSLGKERTIHDLNMRNFALLTIERRVFPLYILLSLDKIPLIFYDFFFKVEKWQPSDPLKPTQQFQNWS